MGQNEKSLGKLFLTEDKREPAEVFHNQLGAITGYTVEDFKAGGNYSKHEEEVEYRKDNWTLYQDAFGQCWELYDRIGDADLSLIVGSEPKPNVEQLEEPNPDPAGFALLRLASSQGFMHSRDHLDTERSSQFKKGYTMLRDLGYSSNVLPQAAQAYLHEVFEYSGADSWPFNADTFKPSEDPIRNLTKAATLIMAAIDQLTISKILSKGYNGEGQTVSSQVNAIEYNPLDRILTVVFKSGTYDYKNVDADTYVEAYQSESIGKWINSVLKANPEKYPYRKIG